MTFSILFSGDPTIYNTAKSKWSKILKSVAIGTIGAFAIGLPVCKMLSISLSQMPVPTYNLFKKTISITNIIKNPFDMNMISNGPYVLIGAGLIIGGGIALTTLAKNRDNKEKYTTLQLIEDLMVEIQKYSEELAILFPERVYRYRTTDLSRLWGYSKKYVSNHLSNYRHDKNYRINDIALTQLIERITTRLGEKRGVKCLEIIDKYKNKEINLDEFDSSLRLELGRISGEAILTQDDEGSQILGFNVLIKLFYIRNRYHDYKFSLERLNDMTDRIELVFAEKAKKCYELIQKYKNLNKGLKEYSQQQHNVGRPHYFAEIRPGDLEKAYLFGFMGHDGYLATEGRNRIGLKINPKDDYIIYKLTDAIGLDLSEVKIRNEKVLRLYKGEKKEYYSIHLKFRCKPMYEDLERHGFIGSKLDRKEVPAPIKNLIEQAKLEDLDLWTDTLAGRTVLAWLLGFYDADGTYKGYYSGRLYSANKQYLSDIKRLFGLKNKVYQEKEPGEITLVFDKLCETKGFYSIPISSRDVFIKMMESYIKSLDRKRPDDYRVSSDYFNSYLGFSE